MSDIAGETTFKIRNTKLYVPIVTLSTKDNVNLTKQLNEGFKRPVYWNEHKTKIESKHFILMLLFKELKDCLFLLLITLLLMLMVIQLTILIIEL